MWSKYLSPILYDVNYHGAAFVLLFRRQSQAAPRLRAPQESRRRGEGGSRQEVLCTAAAAEEIRSDPARASRSGHQEVVRAAASAALCFDPAISPA